MTIALVAKRMVTLPTYNSTEYKSGQVFHNLLETIVKIEVYPDVAIRVDEMLEDVETECSSDVMANPSDDVEAAWLRLVKEIRSFARTVAADVKSNGAVSGVVIPVSFKTGVPSE